MTPNGFKAASVEPQKVQNWWQQHPDANIGIPTGETSGLLGIDMDPHRGGKETYLDLENRVGTFPVTVQSRTGGGGRHILFRYPETRISSGTNKLGQGIDVKGEGGYIVAPPSNHASGQNYAWVPGRGPGEVELASLPLGLLNLLTQQTSGSNESEQDANVQEGQRNTTLTAMAGTMRRAGFGCEAMKAALLVHNSSYCDPPLPDEEVIKIAASIAEYKPDPASERCPEFPMSALPPVLQNYVSEAAHAFPCPPDYVALPALVSLGAAIGRARVLMIKEDWRETPRLWIGLVGEAGSMKTPVLDLVTEYPRRLQNRLYDKWLAACVQHKRELILYDARLKKWEQNAKGTHADIGTPPDRPESPVRQRIYVDDFTIEALTPILQDNPRGVFVSADELAAFFRSMGQYKAHGGADRKRYLSLWAGRDLEVDRVGRHFRAPAPFFALFGGIQSDALADLEPEAGARDGLLHRLLLVEPRPVRIRWSETIVSSTRKKEFGRLFGKLYALEPAASESGLFQPKMLKFTAKAQRRFVSWHDAHCRESEPFDFPTILKGPWAKLRGYCASISLILALVENPEAHEVDEEAVQGGVTLIDGYFKPQLRRLYTRMLQRRGPADLASPTGKLERCRAIIERTLSKDPLQKRDLQMRIGGGRYTGSEFNEALATLIKDAVVIDDQGLLRLARLADVPHPPP